MTQYAKSGASTVSILRPAAKLLGGPLLAAVLSDEIDMIKIFFSSLNVNRCVCVVNHATF